MEFDRRCFAGSVLCNGHTLRSPLGREVARQAVKKGYDVVVVDKLTYAGDLARLKDIRGKYKFYKADICDKKAIDSIFKQEKPGTVMHLAAESHVDRSIADASPFIRTNFEGTQVILDAARKRGTKRLIHMSTDEIYGEIEKGKFSEKSPPAPNSPYSASKAAADMLRLKRTTLSAKVRSLAPAAGGSGAGRPAGGFNWLDSCSLICQYDWRKF